MASKAELDIGGAFSLRKLKEFKEDNQTKADNCKFWQGKKKRNHLSEVERYDNMIKKLGDRPTSIDIAFVVPDSDLAKMGW